jgi:hypothetical protein
MAGEGYGQRFLFAGGRRSQRPGRSVLLDRVGFSVCAHLQRRVFLRWQPNLAGQRTLARPAPGFRARSRSSGQRQNISRAGGRECLDHVRRGLHSGARTEPARWRSAGRHARTAHQPGLAFSQPSRIQTGRNDSNHPYNRWSRTRPALEFPGARALAFIRRQQRGFSRQWQPRLCGPMARHGIQLLPASGNWSKLAVARRVLDRGKLWLGTCNPRLWMGQSVTFMERAGSVTRPAAHFWSCSALLVCLSCRHKGRGQRPPNGPKNWQNQRNLPAPACVTHHSAEVCAAGL